MYDKKQTRCPAHTDRRESPETLHRLVMDLLAAEAYPIEGWGTVVARLWRMRPEREPAERREGTDCDGWGEEYAVELTGLGMRRMYCVGSDGVRAERLFAVLVRNTVTPCTLREVLEDLDEQVLG